MSARWPICRTSRLFVVFVVLAASPAFDGCATKQAQFDWAKSGGTAEELEKAEAECIKKAEDATAQTRHDWPAVHSMINVFLECMKEKGWELDEKDEDD